MVIACTCNRYHPLLKEMVLANTNNCVTNTFKGDGLEASLLQEMVLAIVIIRISHTLNTNAHARMCVCILYACIM